MKKIKLKIQINKPINEVFNFCINPQNTSKWIDTIKEEKTNEWPIKLGSVYKNTGDGQSWDEYKVTDYKVNEVFELTAKNGNYHVRYTLAPLNEDTSELEYFEWVVNGDLENPFTLKLLERLKEIIEN